MGRPSPLRKTPQQTNLSFPIALKSKKAYLRLGFQFSCQVLWSKKIIQIIFQLMMQIKKSGKLNDVNVKSVKISVKISRYSNFIKRLILLS